MRISYFSNPLGTLIVCCFDLKIEFSTCSRGHQWWTSGKTLFIIFDEQLQTRGPRGPWVAHLRKRSQATVEPIIENPRGII